MIVSQSTRIFLVDKGYRLVRFIFFATVIRRVVGRDDPENDLAGMIQDINGGLLVFAVGNLRSEDANDTQNISGRGSLG